MKEQEKSNEKKVKTEQSAKKPKTVKKQEVSYSTSTITSTSVVDNNVAASPVAKRIAEQNNLSIIKTCGHTMA